MPASRFQTTDFRLYDVAPDGSKFLMTRTVGAQVERRNINIVLNAPPDPRRFTITCSDTAAGRGPVRDRRRRRHLIALNLWTSNL